MGGCLLESSPAHLDIQITLDVEKQEFTSTSVESGMIEDMTYNFHLHGITTPETSHEMVGVFAQDQLHPFGTTDTALLSPDTHHMSTSTAARTRRRNRSRLSSRSPSRSPNLHPAPDFEAVSDLSKANGKGIAPALFQGDTQSFENLAHLLQNGTKRKRLPTELRGPYTIPGLVAIALSAQSIYKWSQNVGSKSNLTVKSLHDVLCSQAYFDFVKSLLSYRVVSPEYHETIAREEFGWMADPQHLREINSIEVLVAIVTVHDFLHSGSHRIGIIRETGCFEDKTPVYEIKMAQDRRDHVDTIEPYFTVWIYVAAKEYGTTWPTRWSAMSSSNSSQNEIHYCLSCWKTFSQTRALE